MRDIEAGYQLTRENHPGTFDPANPGFLSELDAARAAGLALAAKVRDAAGYEAAIYRFSARIGDGHAGMYTELPTGLVPATRWPGFIAAWRGDALYVYGSEPGGPPAGSRLESCDGRPARQLIEENVFAFFGRSDEPGNWWTHARKVFVDAGNPFVRLPQRCLFNADGQTFTNTLTWRPFTEQSQTWWNDSGNGERLPVGLTEPRSKLYWVAMPTFQPDEKERDAYREMGRKVTEERGRYLDADAIVIDLRHNQGGSSSWSLEFASALWGKARVERRMRAYQPNLQAHWRASAGNVEYTARMADELAEQKQVEAAQAVRYFGEQMAAALARGERYFVDRSELVTLTPQDRIENLPSDPPEFKRPVYVIVPGQCASACLEALDVFTRFGNTRLIGAPSSADSTYMEVRVQQLESGMSWVIIPVKVYTGRARGKGQSYQPAVQVNDLAWSTANMQKVIERDLATRAAKP